MKPFLTTAVLAALAATPAVGGAIEVELPAHVEWCTIVQVPDTDQLTNREAQQAVFDRGVKPITDCARANAKQLSRIGVPSLSEIATADTDGKAMRLTYCAAIVSAADALPTCEGVGVRRVPAQKIAVDRCQENEGGDTCAMKMSEELRGDPWKLDDAAIHSLAFRYVQATDALGDSVDTWVALLTFGSVNAVAPPAPAGAAPERALPYVIIVAPLPPASPPAAAQPSPGKG